MTVTRLALLGSIAAFGLSIAAPAQALTMQECSAKYSAAKTAGTLNGQKWNDFRKAECGTDAAATPAAATTTAQTKPAEAKPTETKPVEAKPPAAPKATPTFRSGPGRAIRSGQISNSGGCQIFQGKRR